MESGDLIQTEDSDEDMNQEIQTIGEAFKTKQYDRIADNRRLLVSVEAVEAENVRKELHGSMMDGRKIEVNNDERKVKMIITAADSIVDGKLQPEIHDSTVDGKKSEVTKNIAAANVSIDEESIKGIHSGGRKRKLNKEKKQGEVYLSIMEMVSASNKLLTPEPQAKQLKLTEEPENKRYETTDGARMDDSDLLNFLQPPINDQVVQPSLYEDGSDTKWENILLLLYPEKAKQFIHAFHQIFGIFDRSALKILLMIKLFLKLPKSDSISFIEESTTSKQNKDKSDDVTTCLSIETKKSLRKEEKTVPEIIKEELRNLLSKQFHTFEVDEENPEVESFFNLPIDIGSADIVSTIGNNFIDILTTLLPSHSTSLIEAVNVLMPTNLAYKTYAVCHIVHAYSKRHYTYQKYPLCLNHVIEDIKTNDCGTLYKASIDKKAMEPIVVFDTLLNQTIPKIKEEVKILENKIKTIFEETKSNIQIQQWILQQHKSSYNGINLYDNEYEYIHNHRHCDNIFHHININSVNIFYGSLHASVVFNFDIEGSTHRDESFANKLNSLENLCRVALENLENIIPRNKQIKYNDNTIVVEYDETKETPETIVIENFRELYGRMQQDMSCNAFLLEKLKEKKISQFNTIHDIQNLLSMKEYNKADKLQVILSNCKKNSTVKINANYTLWPSRTRKLSQMEDSDLTALHSFFKINLKGKYIEPVANYIIHNMPIFNTDINLFSRTLEFINTPTIILQILTSIKEKEGTLGDILDCLSKFTRSHHDINLTLDENELLEIALQRVSKCLENWMKTAFTKFRKRYGIKLPSAFMSRTELERFISQKYRDCDQLPTLTREAFLERMTYGELLVGNQIWIKRSKVTTGTYFHLGVFIGQDETDEKYKIVHVQPVGLPNVLDSHIVSEDITDALTESDEIFVVRYRQGTETPFTPEQIKKRALKCCEEPRIRFKYSGYWGTCETFAAFICGTRSVKDLNTQGFQILFEEETSRKQIIGDSIEFAHRCARKLPSILQPCSSEDLLSALHKRLQVELNENITDDDKSDDVSDDGAFRENETHQLINQRINTPKMGLTEFLNDIGLSKLEEDFVKQEVDLHMLLNLSNEELKDVGIEIFGQRKKILGAAERYKSRSPSNSVEEYEEGSPESVSSD